MAKWNKVEGTTNCGYKHDQHVLVSKTASAKVWSQYAGQVDISFDTDDSPSITGRLSVPGLTKEQLMEFGKKIVSEVLLPKYAKTRKPSKKVAKKAAPKARNLARKVSKPVQKASGNSKQSLSLPIRQHRDSRGRFA